MTAATPPDAPELTSSSAVPPKPRRRWPWVLAVVCLLPLLLLAALGSEAGLRAALAAAQSLSGGAVQVATLDGSLASGNLRLRGVLARTALSEYQLDELALRWRPAALWRGRLDIDALELGVLRLRTLAPDPTPPSLPADLRLPLALHIERLRLARLEVGSVALGPLLAKVDSDGEQHRLWVSEARTPWGEGSGEFTLAGAQPFALSGVWRHGGQLDGAPINGEARLSGDLRALQLALALGYQHSALGARATLAPFAAQPFARLRQAEATLVRLNPAQWLPGAPEADISLSVASAPVSAARQRLRLRADNALAGDWAAKRLPWQDGDAELDIDADALTLRQLTVHALDGEFTGSGHWRPEAFSMDGVLRGLRLQRLAPALPDWPADGAVQLRGRPDAPQLSVQLNDRQQRELRAELALAGVGAARKLLLNTLQLRDGPARLDGAGELALAGERAFRLHATLRQLNPARWSPQLDAGQLNAALSVQGAAQPLRVQGELTLADSQYRGQPASARLRGQWDGQRAHGLSLDAQLGGNQLHADGALGGERDSLRFTLAAPRLEQLGSGFAGELQGQGQLLGQGWRLRLNGELRARQLRAPGGVSVDSLQLQARLPDDFNLPGEATLEARQLRAAGWQISSAQARYQGQRARHTLSASARGDGPQGEFDVQAALEGGWQNGQGWQGRVLKLSNQGRLPLALDAPASVQVQDAQRWRLSGARLRALGARLNIELLARRGALWSSQGQLSAVSPSEWLKKFNLASPLDGPLLLAADWRVQDSQGRLTLRREAGDVWPAGQSARPLRLEQAQLQFTVSPQRWQAQAQLRSAHLGRLDANGDWRPAANGLPNSQSPLRLAVNADAPDLAAWATWLPPGMRVGGRLAANVSLEGSLATPRWRGALKGEALALSRPADGLALENGQLRASLQDELVKLDMLSLRDRQGGELSLSGQANWRRPDSAQFTLNVRKLAALSHPSRSLSVSGQAQLRQQGSGLLLSGGFTVDQGRITLPDSDTPSLGDDVVIVGRPRAESDALLAIPVAVALDLDLGEQFRLSGKGLDVKLAGRLRLAADAGQAPRATGAVRVVSGHYAAYGQRLDISRGVLTFVRRLDDPGLDVLAVRKGLSVEPGVEISGTAQAPRVQLVSTPELPDSEKLSWLVLGRSATALRGGETDLLFSAASTLLGSSGALGIQQQLAARLGLDELSVGAASNRPTVQSSKTVASRNPLDNQVVTLGKRLASGLYLGYEQSLTGVGQAVKLTWEWSRQWSMVLRAGEQSALDVVYGRGFD